MRHNLTGAALAAAEAAVIAEYNVAGKPIVDADLLALKATLVAHFSIQSAPAAVSTGSATAATGTATGNATATGASAG